MLSIKEKHIVILSVSLTSVVVACTPTFRYGILNTLFDGVPPPTEDIALVVGKDTLGQPDSTRMLAEATAIGSPKIYYHPPHKDKKCASCHNQQHMGQLVAEEPQLCYQCHENNNEKQSFMHGPVGAGYCTSCHSPHMAEVEKLLLNDGDELCFNCHSSDMVTGKKIHQNVKKKEDCLDCHSPHGSENRFMLQMGACYNCHKDKTDDYSFMHGPVSGNYCSTCHDSHASKNENLLLQTGQVLCLNCHDSSTIFKNQEHQDSDKEPCIRCHNPHGGENEFMLN